MGQPRDKARTALNAVPATFVRQSCKPDKIYDFGLFHIDRRLFRKYDMLYKSYFLKGVKNMAMPEGKYAWTATVGEKGQIVIPKQAREVFHIKPGDTLLLLGDEQRGIAIPNKGAFSELFMAAFDERNGGSD